MGTLWHSWPMVLRRTFSIALISLCGLFPLMSSGYGAELQGLTSTAPATAGGIGGEPAPNALCPQDEVIVGISITPVEVGQASPDFSFYCRGLDEKGSLTPSRSSSANSSNVDVLGNGRSSIWCPDGHAAVGIQVIANKVVSGAGLVCSTPPRFTDISNTSVLGNAPSTLLVCPARQALVGFNIRKSGGIERIGGYCSAFKTYRLFYATNGALGKVPQSVSVPFGEGITLPSSRDLTRVGFAFQGWSDGVDTFQPGETYFPKASNVTISALWRLLPPGKPSPPDLTPGIGQIDVEVSRPPNSARITYYLVSSPDGIECTIKSPDTSCVIGGLAGNRKYSFMVVAGNDSGRSEPSDPAFTSLISVPESPRNLRVNETESGLDVSWSPPENDGGSPVLSYFVGALDSREGAKVSECRVLAPETSCRFKSLFPGRTYLFSVVAINEIGQSDPLVAEPFRAGSGTQVVSSEVKGFKASDDPSGSLDLLVTGYALLLLASTAHRTFDAHGQKEFTEINVGRLAVVNKVSSWGDKSKTWAIPGTLVVDRLFNKTAERVHPFTKMFGRSIADGSYIRAIFGAGYLTLPLLGITIGISAATSTDYLPLPPSFGWLLAGVAIAVADAFSGAVAAAAFSATIAIRGGLNSSSGLLTLLGIAAIMFAPALIASNARPLRRQVKDGNDLWERLSDYALASLFAGWAASKMVNALPAFAERTLPITDSSRAIGVCVALFMILRLLLEELAVWAYPRRLTETTPRLEEPWRYHEVVTPLIKTGVFVYLAIPFVGASWELFAGASIFLLGETVAIVEPFIPKSAKVHRWIPKGALKTLVMIFVGAAMTKLLISRVSDPLQQISLGFVLLGIPTLCLKFLVVSAVPSPDNQNWRASGNGLLAYRLGGILVFVALAAYALGYSITGWI